MLGSAAHTVATRGHALAWTSCFPDRRAYYAACYRLRKAGLVAYRRDGGAVPVMYLTDAGESAVSPALRRHSPWPKSWDGLWRMLLYDVPEKDRAYRESLRAFLKRMRMGCLQRSVWITPRDIRPDFEDLQEAASVGDYAFLFESRTVLGQRAEVLVKTAWNMDELGRNQARYIEQNAERSDRVRSACCTPSDLANLARADTLSFLAAMDKDPFLPRPLWPRGYRGEEARRVHRLLGEEIARRL